MAFVEYCRIILHKGISKNVEREKISMVTEELRGVHKASITTKRK